MAHLPAPAGLSVDQNVSRVASEIGDVLADPLEYCDNVEHAGVAGGSITLASDFRQIQIPKQVQAVIMSHHDHIMIASEAVLGLFLLYWLNTSTVREFFRRNST